MPKSKLCFKWICPACSDLMRSHTKIGLRRQIAYHYGKCPKLQLRIAAFIPTIVQLGLEVAGALMVEREEVD